MQSGPRRIGYPRAVQARWVITGALAVVGAFWVAALMLILFGVRPGWGLYGAQAAAALAGGALMVAHAPLRPWREPVAAGVLAAVATTLVLRSTGGLLAAWPHALPAAAGLAAASGVLAGLGGLAARRSTAAIRTDLLIALSLCVIAGTTFLMVRPAGGLFIGLLAIPAGGFITQVAIPYRRPWTCALGGGMYALTALSEDLSAIMVASTLVAFPFMVLLGYLGARLACSLLRRKEEPPGVEVPTARAG